jgi:hypothetical protein
MVKRQKVENIAGVPEFEGTHRGARVHGLACCPQGTEQKEDTG